MPRRLMLFIAMVLMCFLCACAEIKGYGAAEKPCSSAWLQAVEDRLGSADSHGHGPDVGSLEWRSVVEFKLGVLDRADVPDRASDDWCEYINERLFNTAI